MKDARGHGSNKRGNLSVPDQHQHRILRDTLKNPLKGKFLGGPDAAQSAAILRSKFGYSDAEISKLTGVTNASAAGTLASGPKSAPAPVHDSQINMTQFVADMKARKPFTTKTEVDPTSGRVLRRPRNGVLHRPGAKQ